MVKDIAAFLDGQFVNPAVAAVAGISPASITNGAPTAAATTNPLADILGLISHFVNNNIPVDGRALPDVADERARAVVQDEHRRLAGVPGHHGRRRHLQGVDVHHLAIPSAAS